MDFAALGLDPRVARAASKRFAHPTAVQARAVPLALSGQARGGCCHDTAAAGLRVCLSRALHVCSRLLFYVRLEQ